MPRVESNTSLLTNFIRKENNKKNNHNNNSHSHNQTKTYNCKTTDLMLSCNLTKAPKLESYTIITSVYKFFSDSKSIIGPPGCAPRPSDRQPLRHRPLLHLVGSVPGSPCPPEKGWRWKRPAAGPGWAAWGRLAGVVVVLLEGRERTTEVRRCDGKEQSLSYSSYYR